MSTTRTARQFFIRDVLKEVPPYAPSAPSSKSASSTRGPSKGDFTMKKKDRLRGIVVVPELAEQLCDTTTKWATYRLPKPLSDAQAQRWRPRDTNEDLPPFIYSEQDTREWVTTSYLRPALGIFKACMEGAILSPGSNPLTAQPYYASWSGPISRPIPDNVLWLKNPIEIQDIQSGDMTIEMKTANAMMGEFSRKAQIYQSPSGKSIVVPFVWPEDITGETTSKETKILVQVEFFHWWDSHRHSWLISTVLTRFMLRCLTKESNTPS